MLYHISKITLLICFCIGVLTVSGCQKVKVPDERIAIRADFNIPAGLNTIETHVIVIENVDTKLLTALTNAGKTSDDVKSVNSGSGKISLQFNGYDLSFIRDVKVRGVNPDNRNDYIDLFYQDQINYFNSNEITLFNTLQDSKSIFLRSRMNIEVRLKLRGFSQSAIPTQLNFDYGVFYY